MSRAVPVAPLNPSQRQAKPQQPHTPDPQQQQQLRGNKITGALLRYFYRCVYDTEGHVRTHSTPRHATPPSPSSGWDSHLVLYPHSTPSLPHFLRTPSALPDTMAHTPALMTQVIPLPSSLF
ncbi:hypothetical protein PLESTB_000964900 [Pleodorina starrii]|uniref:Uncharacterized protein n=1 Tax=Pleodorina starrii TaxID=330485 RepID=A0A9W6BN05_9CHLO|nr:hypothetical protein PLESTM_001133100 [Pleodorina starrii]GLC55256.1 hypothetical protein PLESTB_000964900 [Pleodorina starrii]GLC70987.1 hypothetical protein PLESTF_001058200 [Pleodorina starrii]